MTPWQSERKALEDEWFRTAALGIADSYVYRYYDADGRLLYVGQTAHLTTRDKNHRNTKAWYPQIARREVSGPFTKDIALAAEFFALQTEDPIHNRTRANGYRGPYSLAWYIAESEDYHRRCDADPDFLREEMTDVLDAFSGLLSGTAAS